MYTWGCTCDEEEFASCRCREESRSLSFSLFSVHSIPWRECPPTFFGDVMDETHLEEDITSFSWSSILLPGNR